MKSLKPESKFALSLTQLIAALLFTGAAGYSVATVQAQLDSHESDSHPSRLAVAELTLAKVEATLALLTKFEIEK